MPKGKKGGGALPILAFVCTSLLLPSAASAGWVTNAEMNPTPVYMPDFETGDFSQIFAQLEKAKNRITLTTVNALEGTYSALIKNGPGDSDGGGSGATRTEILFQWIAPAYGGGSLEGKETWITWDQKLGSNFQTTRSWCVLTQFHGGAPGASPVFAIETQAGDLRAVVRGGPPNGNYQRVVMKPSLPRGVLLHFKVHHRWSTGSGGLVEVWVNGVLKATINGPNLYSGYESAPYFKGGIYRSETGVTRDSRVWYDNVRWYTSDPG